jgi:hypothetical protein
MDILVDGLNVLVDNKEGIVILFVTVWGLGSWGAYKLFRGQEISFIQELLISITIGTLLMTWFCVILILLGQISRQVLMTGSFTILATGIFCMGWSISKKWGIIRSLADLRTALIFSCLLFAFLLSRLAFGRGIILPPYDDSPEHYSMIVSLLDPQKAASTPFYSLSNITQHYYHFGFHAIAVWLTVISNSDPAQVMVWLGQIFIVYSSLSVFVLALALTESIPGAFVAALFAGVAWRMPAFAANWGKYPAITGLAFLPGWVGLFMLYQKSARPRIMKWLLFLMIVVGLGLIHTRLIICFALIGAGYIATIKVLNPRDISRFQLILIFCVALLSLFAFIRPIIVYYSTGAFIPIALVIVLLPFAVLVYPRAMVGLSLAMLGVWSASKAPVFFDGYGANWLDAPFVELLLFIPLSLFSGIGFAGFLKTYSHFAPFPKKIAIILPVLAALIGFGSSQSFSPDKCCNYVSRADLSAIEWIDKHSSSKAVVWIAGFKPKNYMLGTDAGIWISALTDRNVNKLRYDINWNSESGIRRLCQKGYSDVYVYKGSMPYSFEDLGLSSATWLEQVYRANSTIIYRVSCSSGQSTQGTICDCE